jgi:uncharacterized protein
MGWFSSEGLVGLGFFRKRAVSPVPFTDKRPPGTCGKSGNFLPCPIRPAIRLSAQRVRENFYRQLAGDLLNDRQVINFMPRPRSGFYSTIEYIGPRPQKPKRKNFFGGWVIIVIAVGMGFWFGRPLVPFLKATNVEASMEQADLLISSLKSSGNAGGPLAAAALEHSGAEVVYDRDYYKIAYPGGDVPANKGMAADVIVRCYRQLGIDLQVLVHEDMTENFRLYPQLWEAAGPDTNIDHRRVPNLQRFFERKGETLTPSRNPADYKPGDIVVWSLANAETHIGIVVPGPGDQAAEPWVVHNMGSGVKWEDVLFDQAPQRHFRFPVAGK